MTRTNARHRHVAGALLGVAVAVVALGESADGSPHARARSAARAGAPPRLPACTEAGRAAVEVPDGVDGFRVFVDVAHPDGATDVTVLAARRDFTLRAFGPGVFGLELSEPVPARRIEVALEPVLDAPAGVCVARVELLRGGAVVGTARIR